MTVVIAAMSLTPISTTNQLRSGVRPHRSPPRNDEGEITCTHDDCSDDRPTFRRLCEYNKHMDKHERPYKCGNPACRKNPGFTYAGGLLRHQREVHSMHRVKDPFFCPHTSCNRSTGVGFSRRENLEEHLRRRHSGASPDDTGTVITTTPTTTGASPGSEHRMRRLEPLPSDRKRQYEGMADDDRGGSDSYSKMDAHMAATERENDRLRAQIASLQHDLFRSDQQLAEISQDNKRLRGILGAVPVAPTTVPLPPRHPTMYQHQLHIHQPQQRQRSPPLT